MVRAPRALLLKSFAAELLALGGRQLLGTVSNAFGHCQARSRGKINSSGKPDSSVCRNIDGKGSDDTTHELSRALGQTS
jgi:hypothetical protein